MLCACVCVCVLCVCVPACVPVAVLCGPWMGIPAPRCTIHRVDCRRRVVVLLFQVHRVAGFGTPLATNAMALACLGGAHSEHIAADGLEQRLCQVRPSAAGRAGGRLASLLSSSSAFLYYYTWHDISSCCLFCAGGVGKSGREEEEEEGCVLILVVVVVCFGL